MQGNADMIFISTRLSVQLFDIPIITILKTTENKFSSTCHRSTETNAAALRLYSAPSGSPSDSHKFSQHMPGKVRWHIFPFAKKNTKELDSSHGKAYRNVET